MKWFYIVAILVSLGSACYVGYTQNEKANKIGATRQQLKSILSSEERFNRFKEKPELDIWGTEIKALTDDIGSDAHGLPAIVKAISLISAGPDREFDTSDDVFHTNFAVNWYNSGKRVGKATKEFIKGVKSSD